MKVANTKVLKEAIARVNNSFPTSNELMNEDKYMMERVLGPGITGAYRRSQQWEGVAMAINHMFRVMQEKDWYSSYAFTGKKGSATLLDWRDNEYEVGFDLFEALNKIVYMMNLGLELNEEQYQSYLDLKCASVDVYKILD